LGDEVMADALTKDKLSTHDKRMPARSVRDSSVPTKTEWACGFSENIMLNTTFELVIESSVPPSHTLVLYNSSFDGITKALQSGIQADSNCDGVLFTIHRYHDKTEEDKTIFPCRDAFVACALPARLMCAFAPADSALLVLPSRVMGTIRGSALGEWLTLVHGSISACCRRCSASSAHFSWSKIPPRKPPPPVACWRTFETSRCDTASLCQ
jgi:hypothetical protein